MFCTNWKHICCIFNTKPVNIDKRSTCRILYVTYSCFFLSFSLHYPCWSLCFLQNRQFTAFSLWTVYSSIYSFVSYFLPSLNYSLIAKLPSVSNFVKITLYSMIHFSAAVFHSVFGNFIKIFSRNHVMETGSEVAHYDEKDSVIALSPQVQCDFPRLVLMIWTGFSNPFKDIFWTGIRALMKR